MGARLPPHGTAVQGGRKIFCGFMAKNFVVGASHPGQMEREGVTSAPRKVHSGKQAAGVAAEGQTTAPSGAVALHTVRCAGSATSGATEEKRRHNNGMWWSLTHHSRTGENRENSTTSATRKSEIFSLFHTYLSR